jgi:hypothetical protein
VQVLGFALVVGLASVLQVQSLGFALVVGVVAFVLEVALQLATVGVLGLLAFAILAAQDSQGLVSWPMPELLQTHQGYPG